VAIGEYILDLAVLAEAGCFDNSSLKDHARRVFAQVHFLVILSMQYNTYMNLKGCA
jgi:hypothetical protein